MIYLLSFRLPSAAPCATAPGSALRLDGEDLRHKTSDEVEDEHDEDQHESGGPGAFHRDGGHARGVGGSRAVRVELGIFLVDAHTGRVVIWPEKRLTFVEAM